MKCFSVAGAAILASCAAPALAQEIPGEVVPPPAVPATAFDGDFLTVGVGAGVSPDYAGSDDYEFTPVPLVLGSIGGVDFRPRGAGIALDFVPDESGEVAYALGIAARLNRDRVGDIDDPVVASLGELDTAIEVGPSVGVGFPALLNPYDSLSFSADAVWDIAGAHNGMKISPSVSYFTPLSRAMAASLSLSTTYIDDDYADYYYSVTPAQSAASGLPAFQADGGFENVGVTLVVGVDLDGDLTNGGFALAGIGTYSRMLGDAKDTPFTSIRGSPDQWLAGAGIGYTF